MAENPSLVFVLNNIRSAYNVGSIFRSADGIGVKKIYCVGYTPTPAEAGKQYLSFSEKQIAKTALGAEQNIVWKKVSRFSTAVKQLKKEGYEIVALEQTEGDISYLDFAPRDQKAAIVLGREVDGISRHDLLLCDVIISIPMRGKKESLNVSVAAAVAGYGITATMERKD